LLGASVGELRDALALEERVVERDRHVKQRKVLAHRELVRIDLRYMCLFRWSKRREVL